MTLTEFLEARIAEDEAVARSMPFAPDWSAHPDEAGQPIKAAGCARVATCAESVMGHIARHDPERVLAECEAKRRVVNLHDQNGRDPSCSSIDYPEMATDCDTLRALALPYADHPDYQPEWRV